MAFSKHHLYSSEEQITSGFAHALAYPGRIKILNKLLQEGSQCVQTIAEDHPISKETLSDHFKVLREFQLVSWEERFPYTFYSINDHNMQEAHHYMTRFLEAFLKK